MIIGLIALTWLGAPRISTMDREKSREKAGPKEDLCGEPLPWEEAKDLFPRYTTAYLVDVETGLRFEVARRGGTYHADIQPLTALDSEIFSQIYQGKWSWKRKAVIVEVGLRKLAGSINGMPHGSGKIQGNNFKGHFCVHFLNSRVHKSGKVDTAHQMMVWKAAGRPQEPFLQAGPEEVVDLVITALDQGEGSLASLGLSSSEADIWLVAVSLLGQMPELTLKKIVLDKEESGPDLKKYRIRLALYGPGKKGKRVKNGEVTVFREQDAGRWLLEGEGLKNLLEDD